LMAGKDLTEEGHESSLRHRFNEALPDGREGPGGGARPDRAAGASTRPCLMAGKDIHGLCRWEEQKENASTRPCLMAGKDRCAPSVRRSLAPRGFNEALPD